MKFGWPMTEVAATPAALGSGDQTRTRLKLSLMILSLSPMA
ncbi:MAG TPA: hypothetical protein VM580_07375 [Labilithrix sp.]|nr:hypothetical protein [Labilithrix sp.]